MNLFSLAWKSLWHRRTTSLLTVASIAISAMLLLGVLRAKHTAKDSFMGAIAQTDLIVGARSGTLQLLLYTIFNMGTATQNVSYETFQEFKKHPAVQWAVPISLGDSHRGFRVLSTTPDFFAHFRVRGDQALSFKHGQVFQGLWDVVIGSQVAEELKYSLDQKIVLSHGVTQGIGILDHQDKPFHVVGILAPTGTIWDRTVYIGLKGMQALHLDWKDGAMPKKDQRLDPSKIDEEKIEISQITSFLVRTQSRMEVLTLQREINTYQQEPLLAIIPGVALSEFWRNLSYFENAMMVMSWMVMVVGLLTMVIALLTSLNERRREMSILRSLGISPWQIMSLLVFESCLLTFAGVLCGMLLEFLVLISVRGFLESEYGFVMTSLSPSTSQILSLLLMLCLGIVIGLFPAWRSMKLSLKDGLRIS